MFIFKIFHLEESFFIRIKFDQVKKMKENSPQLKIHSYLFLYLSLKQFSSNINTIQNKNIILFHFWLFLFARICRISFYTISLGKYTLIYIYDSVHRLT